LEHCKRGEKGGRTVPTLGSAGAGKEGKKRGGGGGRRSHFFDQLGKEGRGKGGVLQSPSSAGCVNEKKRGSQGRGGGGKKKKWEEETLLSPLGEREKGKDWHFWFFAVPTGKEEGKEPPSLPAVLVTHGGEEGKKRKGGGGVRDRPLSNSEGERGEVCPFFIPIAPCLPR